MQTYEVKYKKGDTLYGIEIAPTTGMLKIIKGEVIKVWIGDNLTYQLSPKHGSYYDIPQHLVFPSKEDLLKGLNDVIQ